MATAAMEALESLRSEDEDLVAIVENDACGVDALQCVIGCTFGNYTIAFFLDFLFNTVDFAKYRRKQDSFSVGPIKKTEERRIN